MISILLIQKIAELFLMMFLGFAIVRAGFGSAPSQKGAGGRHTAACPSAATKKFMAKPVQMMKRARRKPHTSAMQSLMM